MADLSVRTQDWVALWDQEPTRQYVQLYTAASTTWTAPAGVTAVKVELWGGGGTGGTAQGNPCYSGGGAGGQYAINTAYTVTPGNNYTVAVAQAKSPTVDQTINGDDSTFNTTGVVAKGGAGGAPASGSTGSGATGSSGSGVGSQIYAGGSGGNGYYNAGGGSRSGGGGGGAGSTGDGNPGSNGDTNNGAGGAAKDEYGGVGGQGVATGNTRNAGGTYGAGGSGGCATGSTNRTGGAGGAGLARLTWTLPYAQAVDLEVEPVTITDTATAAVGAGPTQTLELRQGATVIKAIDLTTVTGDWQTFTTNLSTEERDSITDWSALRLAVIANTSQIDVSWVELYAPLAGASVPVTVPLQTETVTLSEAVVVAMGLNATPTAETVTLSETGTRAACDERATPTADTITVGETSRGAVTPELASVAETVTVGEASGVVVTPEVVASTETVTLSETGTQAACDERATPDADTVTVGEASVALLPELVAPVADTVTLGDAGFGGQDIPCLLADQGTVTVSDAATGQLLLLRGEAAETVTVSETLLGELRPLFAQPAADTVTVSEAAPVVLDPLRAIPSETVTLTDAGQAALELQASVSDVVTVTDPVTADNSDLEVPVSETLTLTDVWAELYLELRQNLDTVVARRRLDTLTTDWATVELPLTTAERNTITGWTALSLHLTATGRQAQVAWVELTTPKRSGDETAIPGPDTVTLSDTVTAGRTLTAAVSETLTVGDVPTTQPPPTIRVYEITVTVPFVPEIPLEAEAAEYLTVADEIRPFPLVTQRNDYVTVTSSATALVTPIVTGGQEAVILSEVVTVEADLNAPGTDTVTLGEAVVASQDVDATPDADTLTLSDEAAGDLDLNTVAADTVTLGEATGGALTPLLAPIPDQGGLTVTDVLTPVLDPLRAVLSDTVTVDAVGTGNAGLNVTDTVTTGESGWVEYWRGITVTDTVTANRVRPGAWGEDDLWVTDTARVTVGIVDVRRADGVLLEDLGWGWRSGEYRQTTVEDAWTLGEAGRVEYVRPITVTDSAMAVRVDDTRFVYRVETLTLSDVVSLPADVQVADTITWDEGGGADFYDVTTPLTITDTATVRLDVLVVTSSETLTVSEVSTPFMADLSAGVWDAVLLGEALTAQCPPVVVATDGVVVTEAGTRAQRVEAFTFVVEAREWIWPWETATAIDTLSDEEVEPVTLTDEATVTLEALEAPASETATLGETVTVVLNPLLVSVTERLTLSDDAFRLSGEASDTLTLTDAASGERSEGVEVPAERTWRVPEDVRTYHVAASDRTWAVDAEDRMWIVHAEDRTWTSEEEA